MADPAARARSGAGRTCAIRFHGTATLALPGARRGQLGQITDPACRDWLRSPDAALLASDLAWLGESGHALLTFDDADFPPLLGEIPSAPATLFVAGDATLLWLPQIAIVGSRNASQNGIATARDFARTLVAAGLAITSGLAEGIDGAAMAPRWISAARSSLYWAPAPMSYIRRSIANSPSAFLKKASLPANSRLAHRVTRITSRAATGSLRDSRSTLSSSRRACAPVR